MLVLDKDEFYQRNKALLEARKIYIPHLTKSLDVAWEMYCKILASQKLERFMGEMNTRFGVKLWQYQKYFRPKCPVCRNPLNLYLVPGKPGSKANVHGYKTMWVCLHGDCIYHEFSKLSPHEWLKKLERKAKRNGNGRFHGVHSSGKPIHQTGCCGRESATRGNKKS